MGKKKQSSSGKSQGKSWLIMNQVKPPEPFSFHESASWADWIKRYKMFHSAVGLSSDGEDHQINMLLFCMGQEAEELLTSLGMTEEKRTSFDSVVTTFEDYFTMKENESESVVGEENNSNADVSKDLTRKLGKPASWQFGPKIFDPDDMKDFDSDKDGYLENLQGCHKNNTACTSNTAWGLVKTPPKLDDSWPEQKTVPQVDYKPKYTIRKVNDNPEYLDNYHYYESGYKSRKSLRKMCQQTLKYSY